MLGATTPTLQIYGDANEGKSRLRPCEMLLDRELRERPFRMCAIVMAIRRFREQYMTENASHAGSRGCQGRCPIMSICW